MEENFKELVSNYCTIEAADIKDEMSFRDDLGMSSLDIMTLLGDVEDEFDVEFDFDNNEQQVARLTTVGGAIELLKEHMD